MNMLQYLMIDLQGEIFIAGMNGVFFMIRWMYIHLSHFL